MTNPIKTALVYAAIPFIWAAVVLSFFFTFGSLDCEP